MGINDLEKWEKDALENRLDKLGMAFIEFNEFNEFSETYKIDFKERILDNDLESIMEEKMNVSYKNYTVTAEDYFMGCKTMLTNEKAALAIASKLYKELKNSNSKSYIDKDFGPKLGKGPDPHDVEGIEEKGVGKEMVYCHSLYRDGSPPEKGYPLPAEIEWMHMKDITALSGDPNDRAKFISDGISATDCV